ncbi:MAG: hypothetical protein ACLU5K_03575 [Christensenellales bacterium]
MPAPFDVGKTIETSVPRRCAFLHVRTDYSPGDEGQLRTRIEA